MCNYMFPLVQASTHEWGMDFGLPTVSIIVPVYNVAPYVGECLESVVRQTYTRIEIIVVDDGSTDDGGALCDYVALRDRRIRVIHTENAGLAAARNLGIAEAMGDFVLFVDSDDWIEPNTVHVLLTQAHLNDADMVCCRSHREWASGTERSDGFGKLVILDGDEALHGVLAEGVVESSAWGKLCKRSLFEGIRYPTGHVFEDVSTTWQLCMRARRVVCVPDALFHSRMREGSIVRSHEVDNLLDYWTAYAERYEELKCFSEPIRAACVRDCVNAVGRV